MTRYLIVLLILLLPALSGCNQSGERAIGETGESSVIADTPALSRCTDPRPQACTQNYLPVCGVHEDGSRRTYSNGCMACSVVDVVGSLAGACPE